jgi:glycosyltransferase involved in cell wall biosynthesis
MIEGPDEGIDVDPADCDAIIAAIGHLHENPDKAVAMGFAGRQALQKLFNWQSQGFNLVALYARMLGQPVPTGSALGNAAAGAPESPEHGRSEMSES